MFKTELHVHTHESSPCCDLPTEKIAEKYVTAGYTTMVVTDHYTPALCRECTDVRARVEGHIAGYRRLAKLLEGRIHVLYGFELRFEGAQNDYLVYGLEPDFLLGYPDICMLSRRAAIEEIHAMGGMIYQAHPFRNNMTVLDPAGLDGIEIFNAHNHHDSRNYLAYAFAKQSGLPGVAGSDLHHSYHSASAGILTPEPITTQDELIAALRAGTYRTFGEIVPMAQD